MTPLDRVWLAAHPLPSLEGVADKNARGRVLIVGGSRFVPGALRLTGEAALRAGAGKVQLATIAEAAIPMGVLIPEAAMIALPTDADGEIAAEAGEMLADAVGSCDCLIVGPGMGDCDGMAALLHALLGQPRGDLSVLIDAGAIPACRGHDDLLRGHGGRVLLTPHAGEMAGLCGHDRDRVEQEAAALAEHTATRIGATIALKGPETVIASPGEETLRYEGGGVGLATGGSGDVLAGIAGALMARGLSAHHAAGWAVWLHGEAGRQAAARQGPVGFLARELGAAIPGLMAETSAQ